MIEFHPYARPAGPLARPMTAKRIRKPHPLKSHDAHLAMHKGHLMPGPVAQVLPVTLSGANDMTHAFSTHAHPHVHASRHAARPMHRAPVGMRPVAMIAPAGLAGYYDDPDGLGFSLKPPKWARKAVSNIGKTVVKAVKDIKKVTTLRNVAKVGAVVGAVLAAPVVLPALASGAGAVGGALFHGVTGAAGLLARGVGAGARFIGSELKTVAGSLIPHGGGSSSPAPTLPDVFDTNGNPVDPGIYQPPQTPAPVATPVSLASPSPIQPAAAEAAASPGSAGSYGGGMAMPSAATPDATPDATAPQTAGIGSGANLPLIALGAVALLMLARSPRRARR